jgi:hypothetical protein
MAKQTDIRNVSIEPADDGGFMVIVSRKAPKPQGGDKPSPAIDYDSLTKKHVFSSAKEVGGFIGELFPGTSSVSKKSGVKTSESGSSRVDTYEDTGEEES